MNIQRYAWVEYNPGYEACDHGKFVLYSDHEAALQKVQAELAAIKAALPDDFSPSKDWKRSDTVNRVIWLREMFRSWKPNPAAPEKGG